MVRNFRPLAACGNGLSERTPTRHFLFPVASIHGVGSRAISDVISQGIQGLDIAFISKFRLIGCAMASCRNYHLIISSGFYYSIPSKDLKTPDPSQVKVNQELPFKYGNLNATGTVLKISSKSVLPCANLHHHVDIPLKSAKPVALNLTLSPCVRCRPAG